jgi:hypothetical protein
MTNEFHAMTGSQRANWLDWANSHDWGAGEPRWTENLETGKLGLHVECACRAADGEWFTETFLAMSPRQLRDWAGY